MANKNDRMVVAHYTDEHAAGNSATVLKEWDKKNPDVKLGAIAIVTLNSETGELEAKDVGQRKTRMGALWGTAVGAAVGLMTGGLGLIPAAMLGAGGGATVGAMFHKKVGMSDEAARLIAGLRRGGVALVVMVDDFEMEATETQMVQSGGTVSSYVLPEETKVAINEAVAAQTEASAVVDAAVAEESEETKAAVAAEMPELAPESAAAVAEIVAATDLSTEDAAKLHAAGVDKASWLLALMATPHGRRELTKATGLSHATIMAGVKKIDLTRVPGVGVKNATLLLAAGVDTVPEMAQRNPNHLHTKLVEVNAEKQIVEDVAEEAEVANWVARAKAAPRIITY